MSIFRISIEVLKTENEDAAQTKLAILRDAIHAIPGVFVYPPDSDTHGVPMRPRTFNYDIDDQNLDEALVDTQAGLEIALFMGRARAYRV